MKYDIIIIGAGPAGAQSALYTARAGLKTLVIEGGKSALMRADKIENYYGTGAISGKELYETGISQMRALGVEVVSGEALSAVFDGEYTVKTNDAQFTSIALLIASGSKRDTPPVARFEEYVGRGASYCAVCDGFFFRNKDVAVLGDGEYARSEAMELKNICNKVYILTNGSEPKADFSQFSLITDKIVAIEGENNVTGIAFEDKTVELSGLFAAIGVAGAVDFARKIGAQTKGSQILVNENYETNVPGLFAAGDCVNSIKQVSLAVGAGVGAAMRIIKYIRGEK